MIFLLCSFLVSAETIDRIAAVVNDEIITLSEVYELGLDYIASAQPNTREAELEVLDSLIQRSLIEQEIQRLGQDITDEELRNALVDVAKSNGLEVDQLQAEVERSGLSWGEYEAEITQSLRQMKFNQMILQPRINVDDAALQDAYRRLKLEQPSVIDLSAIVLKPLLALRTVEEVAQSLDISLEEAQVKLDQTRSEQEVVQQERITQIQTSLSGGMDFATAAKQFDESGLGSVGGKMGTFAEGQMRSDLGDVAFGLEVGEISQAIHTDTGIFILTISRRGKQDPPPFEQLRPQLLDGYYAERFEHEMSVWFEGTKRRAAIEIKLAQPQ